MKILKLFQNKLKCHTTASVINFNEMVCLHKNDKIKWHFPNLIDTLSFIYSPTKQKKRDVKETEMVYVPVQGKLLTHSAISTDHLTKHVQKFISFQIMQT